MRVRLTLEALGHIAAIQLYVGARNAIAARRIVRRIHERVEHLKRFPRMGHPGTVPDTLESKVSGLPYIIVYQSEPEVINVLGIYHAAQTRGSDHPSN